MTTTLSICIPTITARAALLARLLAILQPQVDANSGKAEIIILLDDGQAPIGAKRNQLLAKARGKWVCFIDDDDTVSPDYVVSILAALKSKPDCVGFFVARTVDGEPDGLAMHTRRFDRNRNNPTTDAHTQPAKYERMPNHLNPIRTNLARKVGFLEINVGEDTDYATRLYPLLTSEVFIGRPLYHYQYRRIYNRGNELTNAAQECLKAAESEAQAAPTPAYARVTMNETLATAVESFEAGQTYFVPLETAIEWNSKGLSTEAT